MILGMEPLIFIHTLISLIGIGAGLIVALGLLSSQRLPGWTALFLLTTALTSVTGFFLPADHLKPSHVVGVISLVVLAAASYALYTRNLAGPWRWIYVAAAVLAFYFNVFVLVAQAFLKIQPLKELAPTGSEPPFAISQGVVLIVFIALGVLATMRFRPGAP